MSFRKRLFAWTLCKSDRANHLIYGSYKAKLIADLYGDVVEFGPGSGINFYYMPDNIKWTGIEPNMAFHKTLLLKANKKNIQATILSNNNGSIPLPDNLADFVLCTLVLCSVNDPQGLIMEMKRILKPGGKLIFIEHVAAPGKTRLRLLQNLVNPVNRYIADGCNCNRETWSFFRDIQFKNLELSHHLVKGVMPLHRPHIMGIAVK
jgi:SAM-dependent methyltransferase